MRVGAYRTRHYRTNKGTNVNDRSDSLEDIISILKAVLNTNSCIFSNVSKTVFRRGYQLREWIGAIWLKQEGLNINWYRHKWATWVCNESKGIRPDALKPKSKGREQKASNKNWQRSVHIYLKRFWTPKGAANHDSHCHLARRGHELRFEILKERHQFGTTCPIRESNQSHI